MEKIFFVVTIGRQVEGDIQTVRFDRAFKTASKAEAHAKTLAKVWKETIQMETGPIDFVCQRAVQECEFDTE